MTTSRDEDILPPILTEDVEPFELLVRRHGSRAYGAARAIVRDAREAEDVVQEACLRAYEHLGELEQRARFSAWLTRIAVREALARVRRGKRFEPLEMHPQDSPVFAGSGPSPEEQTSDAEIRLALEAAVARLPDGLRAVFVLRAVEGSSGAEVAECLGISEDAVKTRLRRARSRLQEMLIESVEPSLPSFSAESGAFRRPSSVLLADSPVPMWVYDTETLAFLAVNDAAVRSYGYRREEFFALTLEDIRPREDVAALREDVARRTDGGRVWRHRKKDGSLIAVEVKGHDLEFEQRRARLVLATERLRPAPAGALRTPRGRAISPQVGRSS